MGIPCGNFIKESDPFIQGLYLWPYPLLHLLPWIYVQSKVLDTQHIILGQSFLPKYAYLCLLLGRGVTNKHQLIWI